MPIGVYRRTIKHNRAISDSKGGLYKILTKEFLIKEYIKKNLSTLKIAKNLGVSERSIRVYLYKYNISIKKAHPYKTFNYTLEFIKHCYCQERKSVTQIASLIGCSNQNIWKQMKLNNIPRRSKSESKTGQLNPMFGKTGILHHNYILGLNRNYPLKFNKYIKESIRKRDDFICQYCGVKQRKLNEKLHIHHIDYDKENLFTTNLISLCRSCHTTTNYNRDYWYAYFRYIIGYM